MSCDYTSPRQWDEDGVTNRARRRPHPVWRPDGGGPRLTFPAQVSRRKIRGNVDTIANNVILRDHVGVLD